MDYGIDPSDTMSLVTELHNKPQRNAHEESAYQMGTEIFQFLQEFELRKQNRALEREYETILPEVEEMFVKMQELYELKNGE